MKNLLSLPFLRVGLHEGACPVLELQWLSYAASADLRPALLKALHLSQQHQVKAWLTDDRQQGAIRPRDLDWAEQELLRPLDELGLVRFAHLESQDALSRLTVEALYARAAPRLRFEVRHFADLADARAWAAGA